MRTYWSLSKFADSLREYFGISPMLKYGTSEEWDEYHKTVNAQNKFAVKLIESLDDVQDCILYIPNKFRSLIYFIANIYHGSHCLRSDNKFGTWQDLSDRIPRALLLSVINFIEKECFWMNIMCTSSKDIPDTWSNEVLRYSKQSYMRRKLFPISVSAEERGMHGIEYIKFQQEHSQNTEVYDAIISAYMFAKEYFANYENTLAKMYDMIDDKSTKESYSTIRDYEQQVSDLVTLHCTNIVKYRDYLWT